MPLYFGRRVFLHPLQQVVENGAFNTLYIVVVGFESREKMHLFQIRFSF